MCKQYWMCFYFTKNDENDNSINSFDADMKKKIFTQISLFKRHINLHEFGEGGQIKTFLIRCHRSLDSSREVV